MIEDTNLWGIIAFLFILLVGMALVSVHYRKRYEELRFLLEVKKAIITEEPCYNKTKFKEGKKYV
jgi:hypothetical protein